MFCAPAGTADEETRGNAATDDASAPSLVRVEGGVSYFNPAYTGMERSVNLQPRLNPLAGLSFSHNPVPEFGFMLGFDRDPLLLNRLMARFTGDWAVFGFEAGGFVGLFNPENDLFSPGVSLIVKTSFRDGLVTACARFDSALGRALDRAGDFLQDLYEARVRLKRGWFALDAWGSYRTFVRGAEGGVAIASDWLKTGGGMTFTAGSIDVGFSGGYQTLALRYPVGDEPLDYSYDNIFAGFSMRFHLFRSSELFFDLELPVCPADYIPQFAAAPSLLRACIGFSRAFGKRPAPPPPALPPGNRAPPPPSPSRPAEEAASARLPLPADTDWVRLSINRDESGKLWLSVERDAPQEIAAAEEPGPAQTPDPEPVQTPVPDPALTLAEATAPPIQEPDLPPQKAAESLAEEPAPVFEFRETMTIIPNLPPAGDAKRYILQVGAYDNGGSAVYQLFNLGNAGITAEMEPYGAVVRIIVKGVFAEEIPGLLEKLYRAGIREIWIREQ
ncbi:MAG: hypothetical protein LBG14_05920 [Treponema sp.]|nr:hypothetical protein [Treponema sp.]